MKKQNKRNQFTRIALALLLILSMLGNTLILPAVAQESAMPADEPALPETPTTGEADTDSTTPTLPEPILLTAADVPEFISAAALEERGAVERMRSEETNMSSVIFRNSDGTRTMYMYGLPVKYTAADGTVRDKSTNLVSVSAAAALLSDQPVAETMAQMSTAQQTALQAELGILDAERAADTLHMLSTALTARGSSLSDMAYTTLDNDVYALFPTNLTEGMTLVFGEHSLRMTPATGMTLTAGGNVTKTTTASLSDADVTERLLYPNVFGPGTAVQYTPTLTGVKEEILLSYNVGKNSFDFLLETDGLVLTETNGLFVLINPETEQQVGKLGEIIVFDSAGQIVRGQMTAQTIKEGQIYGVTVSVDEEFLANATYPVAIDPTVITLNGATSRMIEDMGIYNHEDAWMWTFEDHPYVGKTGVGDYLAMLAYRFPFIYNDDHLPFDTNGNETTEKDDVLSTAAQIGSATLVLQVLDSSNYPVTLNAKASVVSWSQNGMRICDEDTYDAALAGPNTIASSVTPEYSSEWSLDITEIMRAWYNHENGITHGTNLDPEKGVLLYCDSTTTQVLLGSVDSSNSYNHPYLLVNYITEEQVGPYYINNKESHEFLLCTDPYTLTLQAGHVADLGTSMEWMLYYVGSNKYALSPADYEGISFINSAGTLSIATFSPEPYCQWTMMTNGTDFVFRNVQVGNRVFSYIEGSEQIGYATLATSVDDITNVAIMDHSKWRLVRKDQYVEFPSLPPTTTAISPHIPFDVNDYLNTSNCSLISPSDIMICMDNESAATASDGTIFPELPDAFVTATITHLPTGRETTIAIHIGTIAEGTYIIESKDAGKYLTGGSDYGIHNSNVTTISFENLERHKWEIDLLDDGYYSIALVTDTGTPYYMTIVYDSAEMTYLAVLQDCIIAPTSDEGKWRIQTTSDGGFHIIPKSHENTGLVLQNMEEYYTGLAIESDTSDLDEWVLHCSKYSDIYVVNLTTMYDDAYSNRYSNAKERIAIQMRKLQNKFLSEFGIWVNVAPLTVFQSYADIYCPTTPSNVHSHVCEHSENENCYNSYATSGKGLKEYHHNNIYNILYRVGFPDISLNAKMVYIGHNNCKVERTNGTVNHAHNPYYGLCFSTRGLMGVMNFYSEVSETKTAIHEFGHLYGVIDHCGNSQLTTDEIIAIRQDERYSRTCIYGEDKDLSSVTDEMIICGGCKAIIEANRNSINHN